MILDRTALMWVSCLSSRSSGSSSSKRTRSCLKRDLFGGAGVKVGSSSGRSEGVMKSFQYKVNVSLLYISLVLFKQV